MNETALVTSDLIDLYDAVFTHGGFTVRFNADETLTPAASGFAVSATDEQWSVPSAVPFADFAAAIERLHALYPTANAMGDGWTANGCTWTRSRSSTTWPRRSSSVVCGIRSRSTIYPPPKRSGSEPARDQRCLHGPLFAGRSRTDLGRRS